MPKTNAEYCRDYRKKRRENKIKKIPKSSTERVREFRARRKASLNVENKSSITHDNDITVPNSESDHNERLIELVKVRRDLYNVQSQHYSDNINKMKIWNEIEETIGLPGAENRWEGLLAQYQKYLSKLKIKSGQAVIKNNKWRYHDQMQFINEFVNCGRPQITSITDEEVNNENISDTDIEETDELTTVSRELDASEAAELEFKRMDTLGSNVHPARKKQKNTGAQQENASSTLMEYILQNKVQERKADPMDDFFLLMSSTVKTFSAIDQHLIKKQVFALVSEIEETYITDHHQMSPAPTAYSTSSSSTCNFPEINHTHALSDDPLPEHVYYVHDLRRSKSHDN